jgi:hypothetical protein
VNNDMTSGEKSKKMHVRKGDKKYKRYQDVSALKSPKTLQVFPVNLNKGTIRAF